MSSGEVCIYRYCVLCLKHMYQMWQDIETRQMFTLFMICNIHPRVIDHSVILSQAYCFAIYNAITCIWIYICSVYISESKSLISYLSPDCVSSL
jgi:hypothetical protein